MKRNSSKRASASGPDRAAARRQEAVPAPSASAAAFDLEAHLPHLLRRAHFEAEACFAELYGAQATSRQLALLVTVLQSPGLSQTAVAARIGLDLNTCSDLVRRTVRLGWLKRRRSAADARAFELVATGEGARLVETLALPLAAPYAQRVAQRLSAAERERLVRLLRKLLALDGAAARRT